MGLKMSKCGFSSLNFFRELTSSARSPRSSQAQVHRHACIQSTCTSSLLEPRQRTPPPVPQYQPPAWPPTRVVSHRIGIGLHTSTTCVICFMTSIFCTAFSWHSSARPAPHRISVALGPAALAPGPLPSSRAKPLCNPYFMMSALLMH